MLFVRWDDLTDRLVGRTASGERQAIRWPEAIAYFKKGCNETSVGDAMIIVGALLCLAALLMPALMPEIASDAAFLALLDAGGVLALFGLAAVDTGSGNKEAGRSKTVSQLFSKDPCIDLRLAALLTVGAMPEWMRKQMSHKPEERTSPRWTHLPFQSHYSEPWRARTSPRWVPEWQKTRLAGEPYSVERAGLDYLELASSIELWDKPPRGSFHDKSFPSANYKLPDSLKNVVVEIVLFLSSLPDSGEEPDKETVEAVMDTIDRLATIDGVSFTETVRRLHEEAEAKKKAAEDKKKAAEKAVKDKAKADYNGEIMELVDATRSTLAVRNDNRYKAVLRGMDKLSKLGGQTPHVQTPSSRKASRVEATASIG